MALNGAVRHETAVESSGTVGDLRPPGGAHPGKKCVVVPLVRDVQSLHQIERSRFVYGDLLWHHRLMTTPGTTLELRCETIPRGKLIERLERELGRSLTHEYRHYLAGEPVNCGTLLELFDAGGWNVGRFEWSGNPADLPTFHIGERIVSLTENSLLRWSK